MGRQQKKWLIFYARNWPFIPSLLGHGLLVDKDGSSYEGEFHNHKRHGEGVMTYRWGRALVSVTTVSIVTETATKVVGCMTQNTVTGEWYTLMVVFMRFVGSFLFFFIAFPCRDSGGLIVTMETGRSFMHQGLFMRDCGLMATLKVCHFSLSLSLSHYYLSLSFLLSLFLFSWNHKVDSRREEPNSHTLWTRKNIWCCTKVYRWLWRDHHYWLVSLHFPLSLSFSSDSGRTFSITALADFSSMKKAKSSSVAVAQLLKNSRHIATPL